MTEEQAEEIIRQRDERRREELYNSIVNWSTRKQQRNVILQRRSSFTMWQ